MPRTTFTAAVIAEFQKRNGFVPVILVDIQLRDGTVYYLSDFPGVFPFKIDDLGGGTTRTYKPWVKAAGPYDMSKNLQTDAGEIVLQNLSGNSIDRDVAAAMAAREFEGALCVVRYWHELLQLTLMELHGTLGEQHDAGDEASFRFQQLFDPAGVSIPADTYSTTCPWKFKGARCGSAGAATVCDKTFATCNDVNHAAIERFTGIPLIPPALEFFKRMEEKPLRGPSSQRWKFDARETDQLLMFSTRNNPSLSGPRTIAYGLVRGAGVIAFTQTTVNAAGTAATQTSIHLLGEGKWNALKRLWISTKRQDETNLAIVHFHAGDDGTLGGGLAATSTGPDQGVDTFWANFPAGAQPLTFSRIAYIVVTGSVTGQDLTAAAEVLGDYEARLCRQFDNAGNQTAFSYTTNPTWQLLDAIISNMLKRDATSGQALSAAEKTRIAFADAVTHAADCDFNIGGGIKRFESNFAINQVTDLGTLLKQMLQICNSYILEVDGALSIRMDKARASTFTLTSDHLAGRVEEMKTNKRKAANRYNGKFRDLNASAIGNIQNVQRASNLVFVNTVTDHLFRVGDYAIVAGTGFTTLSMNGTWKVSVVTSSTQFKFAQVGVNEGPFNGGTFARDESRFMEDSVVIDHEEHQAMAGQKGVGISPSATVIPADLDFGNNTFERVSRILKYQLVRNLGIGLVNGDLGGAAYKIPRELKVQAWMHSVDATSRALMAQLCGDIITIDKSCSEEWAGDYEIITMRFPRIAAGETSNNVIELTLLEYVSAAFTDVANTVPVKSAAYTAQAASTASIQY